MQKILIIAIFGLGLALCGVLLLINFAPAVDGVAGVTHPLYEGMRAGGDGAARLAPIKNLAFLFQVLALAQFACFIALGVTENRRSPVFYAYLAGCYLLTVLVWWQLFSAHQQFLTTGETQYFLGFPTATAWVVYAVWLAGISFVALYVFGFKQFIWSDEDEEKFEQLVQESQNNN